MKLLSTLLLFSAAVWVTAMAWPKDVGDKFLEYLENQDPPSVQPVPASYKELAAIDSTDGARHVYSLDMTIPSENCPSTLKFHQDGNLRTCGKKTNGPSCDSVNINTNGQSYSKVLGRVTAYQFASTDAFANHPQDIDKAYVDGISITYDSSPRKHVWTYASAIHLFAANNNHQNSCPSTGSGDGPWNFVGDNYFCSSGNPGPDWAYVLYTTQVWSNIQGKCSFCGKKGLSFCAELESSTTQNLELRICTDQSLSDEDIRIESVDLYIE